MKEGGVDSIDHKVIWPDGSIHWVHSVISVQLGEDGRQTKAKGTVQDITERKQTDERLHRSRRLEAIGQLTGGIAHDYNNLLGVIIGNLDVLAEDVCEDDNLLDTVDNAMRAALRSADLSKRLLAFSSRSAEESKTINVNHVIKGMRDLLSKTLTPEIEMETDLTQELWLTKVDPGDLEDSILNLAINARDAMAGGGKLKIESQNVHFAETDETIVDGLEPGDYVLIKIGDTGTGMDKKVLDRVFEPFFTTKPPGRGTGLGLSMVYGFVKRCDGQVKIYSELGFGTTISLYLKRAHSTGEEIAEETEESGALPKGTETILMVEDEADLADVSRNALEKLGYKVIVKNNGPDAIKALVGGEQIDLLFTDVVMPGGITGLELAVTAREQFPDLRVLVTSGVMEVMKQEGVYTEILRHRLQKPYRRRDLALKVRKSLDEPV